MHAQRHSNQLGTAAVLLVASVNCVALPASAAPRRTWIHVDKRPGSESCPDEAAIFSAVSRLFPEATLAATTVPTNVDAAVEVTIQPRLDGHEAFVHVQAPHVGERSIAVKDADCRGLDEALAVTLVLLLEPEREATQPNALPSNVTVTDTTTAQLTSHQVDATLHQAHAHNPGSAIPRQEGNTTPSTPNPQNQSTKVMGYAQVGVLGAMGLLARPSIGPLFGFRFEHASGFGIEFDGMRHWAQPVLRAPGRVDISLWGGLVQPCYTHQLVKRWSMSGCVLAGFGQQTAVAAGYRQNGSATRPWLISGGSFRLLRTLSADVSGAMSFGAFAHLSGQGFSVAGVGTVAEPPSIGAFLRLDLVFGSKLF